MRTLRLLVSASTGALPALVLATLLPGGASCSRSGLPLHGSAASAASSGAGGTGGAGGTPETSSASTTGEGGFFPVSVSSASSGSGGAPACPPNEQTITFTVDVPPEGVPATPGQICAAISPVESNKAARVTLTKSPQSLDVAEGFIAIDPALAGDVVGLPAIDVLNAAVPELATMQVSNLAPAPGGFSFHATWPSPLNLKPDSWVQLTVRVTMTVACGPQPMDVRTVVSRTNVALCLGDDALAWVSSGDECKACEIIAEMAPSPIVPDDGGDDLPLSRVLQLRVILLARIAGTLVLFAENDGGEGLEYAWVPSGGEVTPLAPDVVVWTPPAGAGPHLVQAVVERDDAAAVASFTYSEAA
jgi:hypothetical protein